LAKKLDRLGFSAAGEESWDVLLDGALLEQVGEGFGTGGLFADDDAAGVQVVVKRPAFAQEFGGEDQVRSAEGFTGTLGITDRNGGFDYHRRIRIEFYDVVDDVFDGPGVEVVGLGVVVGGGGDDDVVGADIGVLFVQRGAEIKRPVLEEIFDLGIFNRRFLAI
jgi:hypothetical protein